MRVSKRRRLGIAAALVVWAVGIALVILSQSNQPKPSPPKAVQAVPAQCAALLSQISANLYYLALAHQDTVFAAREHTIIANLNVTANNLPTGTIATDLRLMIDALNASAQGFAHHQDGVGNHYINVYNHAALDLNHTCKET